ncbi:hypothetical protein HELRODRAFT_179217 [Helobdella robusta]|uniref:Uncharacterized protein n=1 Tax=Helobdella robusta TaxID=6412 RepID=T1FED4_HELRO|nr:hypothetical protein HELRODRAFT_179217 [Helobdella robusta]ESN95449.1 hypothetical protein HELRODRAFT_179217 [Helobdella robusta]
MTSFLYVSTEIFTDSLSDSLSQDQKEGPTTTISSTINLNQHNILGTDTEDDAEIVSYISSDIQMNDSSDPRSNLEARAYISLDDDQVPSSCYETPIDANCSLVMSGGNKLAELPDLNSILMSNSKLHLTSTEQFSEATNMQQQGAGSVNISSTNQKCETNSANPLQQLTSNPDDPSKNFKSDEVNQHEVTGLKSREFSAESDLKSNKSRSTAGTGNNFENIRGVSPVKKSSSGVFALGSPAYASPLANNTLLRDDATPPKSKERDEKVRLARERKLEEQRKKQQEMEEAMQKAEEVRRKQEEDRRKKIEEARKKEEEHRAIVEERRRKLLDEDLKDKDFGTFLCCPEDDGDDIDD